MDHKPRMKKAGVVVVVGGGAGGSMLAKTLQHDFNVVLVDAKEYFDITWASLRAKVEPAFAKRTLINHREYLPNARIIASTATDITESEVITAQGDRVEYDYLVIATGHVSAGGYTKSEKISYYHEEHNKISSSQSILIIGGGPTGVELASEIIFDYPDKKVVLVHRGPRLLEFLGEKAGKLAFDWLTSNGVEVILNQSIESNGKTNNVYNTSSGEKIEADCHFLCTGIPLSSSWLEGTILKNSLDAQGRLTVDSNLRVKGRRNIFAIGDINDVPYGPNALVSLGQREGIVQLSFITFGGRLPGMLKSGDLFVGKTRKQLGLSSKE